MRNLIRSVIFAAGLVFVSSSLRPVAFAQDATLQIAYVTGKPHEICLSDIKGESVNCLSYALGTDKQNPIWSPDGRFIAYQTYDKFAVGTAYIADLQLQTSRKLNLPFYSTYVSAWSPDGSTLFLSGIAEDSHQPAQIYKLQTTTDKLDLITHDEASSGVPIPSPDGKRIVYFYGYPDITLNLIMSDGSQKRTLVTNLTISGEDRPVWSPDGMKIAFIVNGNIENHDQTRDLYVVNADGSGLRRLTNTDFVNTTPQWSPDGKQLLFYGYKAGDFNVVTKESLLTEVFRVDADGSNLVNLTHSPGWDTGPVWSPDGQWIAFGSLRWLQGNAQQSGIFIMRPDGSDLRMVTNLPPFSDAGMPEASNPVWRPILNP